MAAAALADAEADTPVEASAIGQPGLAGANVSFDVNQAGGKAQLAIEQGWLEFPGVFAQPRIPLDRLQADISWQSQGQGQAQALALQVTRAEFANEDLQGSAQASWHTLAAVGDARFPGVLDLSGQFERAQASRVWRYLPLEIPQEARDYVQQAVQGGVGSKGSLTKPIINMCLKPCCPRVASLGLHYQIFKVNCCSTAMACSSKMRMVLLVLCLPNN